MVTKVFFFVCLVLFSLQGEDKLIDKKKSQQIRPESSALEDSTIKYIEAAIPKLKGKEKISKIQELRNVKFTKFLKEQYNLGYNSRFGRFWIQSKGQIFDKAKEFDILTLPKLDNKSPEKVVAQYYKTKFFGDLESYKNETRLFLMPVFCQSLRVLAHPLPYPFHALQRLFVSHQV